LQNEHRIKTTVISGEYKKIKQKLSSEWKHHCYKVAARFCECVSTVQLEVEGPTPDRAKSRGRWFYISRVNRGVRREVMGCQNTRSS